jgi:hypothetical protein
MALASWYRGDDLPCLPEIAGLEVGICADPGEMALINGLPVEAIRARWQAENIAYVARLYGRPVAYGWVALGLAHIGEVGLSFRAGPAVRYLWDFETLGHCRGRGIYPRLLQAILEGETAADRLWIIHAPENLPSGVSIARAGFTEVGELCLCANRKPGLAPTGPIERALDAADLLGVPLVQSGVSACSRGGNLSAGAHACGCCPWPAEAQACFCRDAPTRLVPAVASCPSL